MKRLLTEVNAATEREATRPPTRPTHALALARYRDLEGQAELFAYIRRLEEFSAKPQPLPSVAVTGQAVGQSQVGAGVELVNDAGDPPPTAYSGSQDSNLAKGRESEGAGAGAPQGSGDRDATEGNAQPSRVSTDGTLHTAPGETSPAKPVSDPDPAPSEPWEPDVLAILQDSTVPEDEWMPTDLDQLESFSAQVAAQLRARHEPELERLQKRVAELGDLNTRVTDVWEVECNQHRTTRRERDAAQKRVMEALSVPRLPVALSDGAFEAAFGTLYRARQVSHGRTGHWLSKADCRELVRCLFAAQYPEGAVSGSEQLSAAGTLGYETEGAEVALALIDGPCTLYWTIVPNPEAES